MKNYCIKACFSLCMIPMMFSENICQFFMCLILGLGLATIAQPVYPADEDNLSGVSVNVSCPDSDEAGEPCGPNCSCTCCPGHNVSHIFVSAAFSHAFQSSESLVSMSSDNLRSKVISNRIFHPPRV